MTWNRLHHLFVLAALTLLALSVTGCAGGAWGATLAALMSLSMLFAAGCSMSHDASDDAGETTVDAGLDASDPGWDAGEGTWESCCVEGRVDTCFCPAGAACNYGWYTDCGGGTCAWTPEECTPDAGAPDAGTDAGEEGTWESCCVEGRVDTCFCPAGVECNYGWYTDCGDGLCAFGPDECPDADAGVPDAGTDAGLDGTWEACCLDGVIDTCFCPAGAICNYGWYNDCGDGTCTDPSTTCPAPPAP